MSDPKENKKKQAMHGRSMVEMLAVLGIMALIVAGAVVWLPGAIQRNRSNNLFKEFSRRSAALVNSPVMDKATKGEHVQIPGVEFVDEHTDWLHCKEQAGNSRRFIVISRNVTREDCHRWVEMVQASKSLYPKPVAVNFAAKVTCAKAYANDAGDKPLNINTKFCGLAADGSNAKERKDLKVAYMIERQALDTVDLRPTNPHREKVCKKECTSGGAEVCDPYQCCRDLGTGKKCCVDITDEERDAMLGAICAVEGEGYDITGECKIPKVKKCTDDDEVLHDGECKSCTDAGSGRVRVGCSCVCDESKGWDKAF